jgi:hypothetical protein
MKTISMNNDRNGPLKAALLINIGQPWQNHGGSFYGQPENGRPYSRGRLPAEHWGSWHADDVDYAIYSYATPIAWRRSGTWFVPPARYSITTSKHQAKARMILHYLGVGAPDSGIGVSA